MLHGNAIIGQSGGPTSVINASLCGIIQACLAQKAIGKTLGMRFGVEGFMRGDVIDLGRESAGDDRGPRAARPVRPWEAAATSSRTPTSRAFSRCSASTTFATASSSAATTRWTRSIASRRTAARQGYELIGVGVPKTVDNDLCGTDHTPGFGSAARYVALSVKQAGMLARDMKRVDQYVIFQTVGRSAGWLPAAAALAQSAEDDAPHVILLPGAGLRPRPLPGRRRSALRPLRLVQRRLRRRRVLRRRHADQRLERSPTSSPTSSSGPWAARARR